MASVRWRRWNAGCPGCRTPPIPAPRDAGFTGQPVLADEAGGSLPPAHLYLALVGLANWYFAATQMTRMALGHPTDDTDHEHYRALITRIAQRPQEPRPLEPR